MSSRRLVIRRVVTGHAYPRNGNFDRLPTERVRYEVRDENGRLVDSDRRLGALKKDWPTAVMEKRSNPALPLNVVTIEGQKFAIESVTPTSHGWAIVKARLLRGDRRLQTLTVKVSTLARQNPIVPPWPVFKMAMDREKRRRLIDRRRAAIHERVAALRSGGQRVASRPPRSASGRAPARAPLSGVQESAALGLVAMGYTKAEAREKVAHYPDEKDVQVLVRTVLKRAGEGFRGGMVD